MSATATHHYGWKPSLPDFRHLPADVSGITLKSEVDPRADMPPVYDQGQLGSCTANAIAAALEYNQMLDGKQPVTPSRLFIYYEERVREGSVLSDAGAMGHDGFKVLRKTGAPPEDLWPYDISRFTEKPPQAAFDAAGASRISKYVHPGITGSPVEREGAIKSVLSNRQTVAFGFTVYQSFEEAWSEIGVMPVPGRGEEVLGGHEVLIVGYLASHPGYALVRNSWGTGWGLEGYFLMPWAVICSPEMSGDWRSIYRPLGG